MYLLSKHNAAHHDIVQNLHRWSNMVPQITLNADTIDNKNYLQTTVKTTMMYTEGSLTSIIQSSDYVLFCMSLLKVYNSLGLFLYKR